MKSSYIAVGYRCNHKCVMCPLSNRERNDIPIPYASMISHIESEGFSAGDHITLSGGEPTLCEYLLDLLEYLMNRKIRVTLLTNSSGFADRTKAVKLARITDSSRFNVVTALHSADPAVHDEITQTPGSFQQSVSGLKNLSDAGVNITVKHILNAKTYKGLAEYADMIIRNFPPSAEIQFTSIDISGNALKNASELLTGFKEMQSDLEKALQILTEECRIPYRISLIEMPLCACSPKYWKYYRQMEKSLDSYIAPNTLNDRGVVRNMQNECLPVYLECGRCDVRCFCPGAWHSSYTLMKDGLLRPIRCSVKE